MLHYLKDKNQPSRHSASAQALTPWRVVVALAAISSGLASPVYAGSLFTPGNLVVSRSVYQGTVSTVTVGQALPNGAAAVANGIYPDVFKNETPDPSFGVTSPIFLDQIATSGTKLNTLSVDPTQIVTSFPSKSELALNLTPDGTGLTFLGYATGINQLDISNSNTPGVIDPTNLVANGTTPTYREIAQLNYDGTIQYTQTNAYSGNNGRAAILGNTGNYYLVGNAGNSGSNVTGSTLGLLSDNTGVQMIAPGAGHNTTVVGQVNGTQGSSTGYQRGFSVTSLGYIADKTGKDDNFRGETIFNNTLYVTKGSGSNGINSVYQVGNAGSLPTLANAATTPITILPGFPTNLAKNPIATGTDAAKPFANITYPGAPFVPNNPFGIWFADANTLYVTDEGNDTTTSSGGISSKNVFGGLEKWSLVNGTWQPDYILQNGLNLGTSYTVSGTDFSGSSGSYTTATEGLRNLTGKVNSDGTVSLYAITSTISAATDQGADPNQLVALTDLLANKDPAVAATEKFSIIDSAKYGEVLRGVSEAPQPVPESSNRGMLVGFLFMMGFLAGKRKQ